MIELLLIEEKVGLNSYFNQIKDSLKLFCDISQTDFNSFQGDRFSFQESKVVFLETNENTLPILREVLSHYDMLEGKRTFLVGNFSPMHENDLKSVFSYYKDHHFIEGCIDTATDHNLLLPLFKEKSTSAPLGLLKEGILLDFGENTKVLRPTLQMELKRRKEILQEYQPKKWPPMGGLSIFSKYLAGSSSGGEFLDIIHRDNKILIVMSSAVSYMISGFLLENFLWLRNQRSIDLDIVEQFLGKIFPVTQRKTIGQGDKPSLDLLLCQIDLQNSTLSGYNFGQTMLLSTAEHRVPNDDFPLDSNSFQKSCFKFNLGAGEKIAILSPGIQKNTNDFVIDISLKDYITDRLPKNTFEMIKELFYYQKASYMEDEFLEYDSSIITIEVGPNANFHT